MLRWGFVRGVELLTIPVSWIVKVKGIYLVSWEVEADTSGEGGRVLGA